MLFKISNSKYSMKIYYLCMYLKKNVNIHFVICETSVNMRYIDVKFFILFRNLLKLCCVSVDLMLLFIF